ncbi:helix-turn-helix domain-containing protein [Kitasatospora sp. NPDC050543]|uniref:helix-turn-helix domain-containing protein n=1 Tax=Kitasatospora sp. NPDC050543 TaxID=3364054 RepID=UPI0037AFA375
MSVTSRAPRPVTQDDYDQVRALHAQGLGRNDIARALDRSGQVISRLAREQGLSFARAAEVATATETRRADLAARRILLAEQLQSDAENLRAQMWQPTLVYSFGGKDNTYEQHLLDEAPAADKRALMATAGMALDRSLKLEPIRDDSGADAARSMLGQLMTGLAEVYREQHQEASVGDEGAGDAP